MTTIQKQIAERLRNSYTCICDDAYKSRRRADPGCARCSVIELEACSVEEGAWDDILGKPSPTIDDAEPVECSCGAKVIISIDDKPEPTINDVREEARRVFGAPAYTVGGPRYVTVHSENEKSLKMVEEILAPTIASAYAALRALPSKVEG